MKIDLGDISEFILEFLYAGEAYFDCDSGVELWVIMQETDTNGYHARDEAGIEYRGSDRVFLLACAAVIRHHLLRGDFDPVPENDWQREFAPEIRSALHDPDRWYDKAFLDVLLHFPFRTSQEGMRRYGVEEADYLQTTEI